jgi:hypothetical protein
VGSAWMRSLRACYGARRRGWDALDASWQIPRMILRKASWEGASYDVAAAAHGEAREESGRRAICVQETQRNGAR